MFQPITLMRGKLLRLLQSIEFIMVDSSIGDSMLLPEIGWIRIGLMIDTNITSQNVHSFNPEYIKRSDSDGIMLEWFDRYR